MANRPLQMTLNGQSVVAASDDCARACITYYLKVWHPLCLERACGRSRIDTRRNVDYVAIFRGFERGVELIRASDLYRYCDRHK